jgi:F420-non-reducing hydrogenase small subunit
MNKPKVGLYWCSSCGGCEEAVVDLAENILKVVELVDIVFWPVAMDFKYSDVEAMQDKEMDVVLINGAIRLSDQEHIVKLLRKKAKLVVANGSCAHLGGVVGLGNFSKGQDLLDRAYKFVPSMHNPGNLMPQTKTEESGRTLELPSFYNTVKALDQVIDVDYYLPGCPTTPTLILNAVLAILQNKLPPKGTVLADTRALCETCPLRDSKPEKLKIKQFKRTYEVMLDPERCYLDQGVICLGPATRGGCEARCIKGNMPCRGCFGPVDKVVDQGAKFVSMLASMVDAEDEEEIKKIMQSIPDPAGLFYKYSMAVSQLKGRKS